ncbi:MAG TPA: Tat pathway signal protein [Caulobacteraceae bacterium]|nr:Tat pathway signal protein [Caulobacteraceae bacterium]
MNRRLFLALTLPALLAPAALLAQGAEKKKGGGISYIQFQTLTATIIKNDGRRGVLTVDAGVDVPDAGLRAKVNLVLPRLRAAYVQVLQAYVYSLNPGAPPDPDYLSMTLQRETDRVLGRPGAKLLLGAMLVN